MRKDLEELKYLNDLDYEEDEPDPKWKKYIVIALAIFMVLLMSSYVYIGYPSFGVIEGRIVSDQVEGDRLELRGIEVVFEEDTLRDAILAWEDNPNVETSLCFHGEREGDIYIVNHSYKPEIESQSYNHVSHEPCDEDTILMFHTHPRSRCAPSQTDMRTLERTQERNPDVAMIIMCDYDRFSVYN